jgi:hypothetical protein
MSAKKSSQPSKPSPAPTPVAPPPPAGAEVAAIEPPWIESTDPRRQLIAKIVLVGLCIYVAALWLLALDQWFNWGIFGPKIPPVP